ncbi:MAG: MFS transporter [Promethearchaeota archaeon]|nr:MAG: MFS transporter [Candidatus Lokiarchaeota archaeon]
MNEKTDPNDICDEEVAEISYSKKIMASYGFGNFMWEFIEGVIVILVFFFYEAEIGLSSTLTALGFIIFALWNGLNDPLLGYLTDRPNRLTRRWGRRFPWMIITFIPWLLCFFLIFTPPNVSPKESPWLLFGWLVLTTCAFDTFFSIWYVSYGSLFPDKFRVRSERLTAAGITVYLGFFGIVLGFLLPPSIISYGQISSYIILALICVVIAIFAMIMLIPGIREDKTMVENFLAKCEEKKEKESIYLSIKQVVKHKNFIAFIIFFLLYQSLTIMMTSSFMYFVRYVIKTEAYVATIIMGMFLIGGIVTLPFWLKYSNKTKDYRKTLIIASSIMICFAIPLTFLTDLTLILITMILFGIGVGGVWIMISPIHADIIDESVTLFEKRREGLYGGFRYFTGRVAMVIQAITFALIHVSTGFIEGAGTQTSFAILGIQLHTGIIPAILMAIGTLIFWKFYDITPDKATKIKQELKKTGL